MKIKEKLAEINESIYQKFLANRRELFRLCSFFCFYFLPNHRTQAQII